MANSSAWRQSVAQFADGFFEDWMSCTRCNLCQGRQHEAALVHGRMWNRQPGGIHDGIAKQENIDINRARAFVLCAATAHLLFDSENGLEQLPGHELCFERESAVQKPGLLGN